MPQQAVVRASTSPRTRLRGRGQSDAKREGKRLEEYVRGRWGRTQGGIVALAAASGVSPDAMYKWFRGVHPPTLEGLGGLAKALGVKRHELVAVIDEDPIALDVARLLGPNAEATVRAIARDEVERYLRDAQEPS